MDNTRGGRPRVRRPPEPRGFGRRAAIRQVIDGATRGDDDEAVTLAAGLLGGHALRVAWAGRVRVVAPIHGMIDRWRAANTAPAYRLSTRVFRNLLAAQTALAAPAQVEAEPIDVTESLPTGLRHLRPASIIVGTPGERRSLVVRLVDDRRVPRAALKIAVTRSAGEGIRLEADALRDPRLSRRAPKLLHRGEVAGHQAMITAHVPGRPLRYGARGVVAAAAYCSTTGVPAPSVWAIEHPWIAAAAATAGVDHETVARALPGRYALTRTHGDFAPWNLISVKSSGVVAIDWEASITDGLPLADLAHFVMASERLLLRSTPEDASRRAAAVLVKQLGHDERTAWMIVALAACATARRERTTGGHAGTVASWETTAQHALSHGI